MRLQETGADAKPNMREDFLKKIGPAASILILVISALGIFLAFTVRFSPLERYESLHDTAYYMQNAETMAELHTELREFVFPVLPGITDSYVSPDGGCIVVHIDSANFTRTSTALIRDFDEALFEFVKS